MSEPSGTGEGLTHRRRLAEALRGLSAEVVACDAPDSLFQEAADATEGFLQMFQGRPRRRRVVAGTVKEEIRKEGKRYHYGDLIDYSPLSGPVNPIAPPMTILKQDSETLIARVSFSSAFEGGPGWVHGGYVAAAFDELLGLVQSLTGKAGMTGTLKVRYRNPCPLHVEVRMEGRVQSSEGRKIVAKGTMHAGERIVADGEAMFILIDQDTFRTKSPHYSRHGG